MRQNYIKLNDLFFVKFENLTDIKYKKNTKN